MTRRPTRRLGSRDGQALVEFAMIVPVLFLLILGLVEFSRAWNTKQVLTDVAREALRNAVVSNQGYTFEDMRAQIDQALERASLDPERAQVTVEGWKAGTGTPARIQIDYRYDIAFLSPFFGWGSDDRSLALTTSFVMRNE